jgi:hypothetical protein
MLSLAVTLLKPLNTTSSVNQLLLASEEGVAGRANLGKDFLAGGTGLKAVATGTFNGHFVVHRVNSFSHLLPPDNCSSFNKAVY